RAVRVIVVEREQDRLLARLSLAPSTVREEAVVAEGPQMRVECLDSFFRSRLHDHAPAALERFFDQRGKHTLERLTLQLLKHDFRHGDGAIVRCGWRPWDGGITSRSIRPPAGPTAARRSRSPSCG